MNTHPMIDSSRPWEQRMQQARRWTLARLHARPPENYAELMEAASKAIARKLPGWKLAAPFDYRADYRRIIRRNLGKGRLP